MECCVLNKSKQTYTDCAIACMHCSKCLFVSVLLFWAVCDNCAFAISSMLHCLCKWPLIYKPSYLFVIHRAPFLSFIYEHCLCVITEKGMGILCTCSAVLTLLNSRLHNGHKRTCTPLLHTQQFHSYLPYPCLGVPV